MSRLPGIMMLLAILASFAGCASFRNCRSDMKIRAQARASYRHSEAAEAFDGYAIDFKKGYERGFCDVAQGSNGAPPPLPPDCYWGPQFKNPEGHERINSWFAGYTAGAASAANEGMQYFNYLPSPHRGGLPLHSKDPYESNVAPDADPEDVPTPEAVAEPEAVSEIPELKPTHPDEQTVSHEVDSRNRTGYLPFGVLSE